MGNYFCRTVLAVELAVDQLLRVSPLPPTEECTQINDMLLDFFFLPPKRSKNKPVTHQQKQRDQALRSEYRALVNGSPFSDGLVHHCYPGGACGCRSTSRSDLVRRVSSVLIRVMYRRRPPEAQEKEWTSVWNAMSFLALITTRNKIGVAIFEQSVKRIAPHMLSQLRAAQDLALVPAADLQASSRSGAATMPEFVDSLDWHQLAGKRVAYVRRTIMQASMQLHVIVLAVITGAQEACSLPYFARTVRLSDCAHFPNHHALGIAQFFSAVLADGHDIAKLLCASRGWQTISQVMRFDQGATHVIRSAFALASAQLYVRHFHRFEQYPWRLAVIGCEAVPEERQRHVAEQFCRACDRCLDVGFGRRLRSSVVSNT